METALAKLIEQGGKEAQGFGGNLNPLYISSGDLGHPGIDVHFGYGTDITPLSSGLVFHTYPPPNPGTKDGYTAIFTLCHTPLEDFEFSYGHVSEIDVPIGAQVIKDVTVIGKEGNKGPVYSGNRLITLAEQAAGNHEGSHRHYQKRPFFKTKNLNGLALNYGQGVTPDSDGYYYQIYAPYNGYDGCVDWSKDLFSRNLSVGSSGYDVFILQRALVREGFASFTPSGYFGLLTAAAVIRYQKYWGLSMVGNVGPLTRGTLNARYFQLE